MLYLSKLVEIVSCLFSNDLGMDRIDFGSIIILSACGMNETFFFSIKFTQQINKDLLDFSYVERTDFFVERTILWNDLTIEERSDLERCQRSDHGTK